MYPWAVMASVELMKTATVSLTQDLYTIFYPSWSPCNGSGASGDIQPVSYRDTEECYCMDMLLQTIGCQKMCQMAKITVKIN